MDRNELLFPLYAMTGLLIMLIIALPLLISARPIPPTVESDGCIIVTDSDTVLYDPNPGEDDGIVYCPTGEVSVSRTGKVYSE